MAVHVLPLNDEKQHEHSESCWCEPEVIWIDPETEMVWTIGEPMIQHHAADCREVSEEVTGESVDEIRKWETIRL